MGCRFCQTGRLRLIRNLTAAEIVGQVFNARHRLGYQIRNVVFMGMGEPLDNLRNVIQAIRILSDQKGFNIAKRYITLSTIGKVDGIRRLAELKWPTLKLAISLNAPNDEVRSKIMPMTCMWPMKRLKMALMDYPLKKSGVFMMEYVLIKHVNDSRDQVRELAAFIKPLKARINVIPYNSRSDSPFESPSNDEVERFCGWLADEKMFVRKRTVKGQHIRAACGQLGNSRENDFKTVSNR
jgi:23S rRNA (adenine2503-C2)-methyltransferase